MDVKKNIQELFMAMLYLSGHLLMYLLGLLTVGTVCVCAIRFFLPDITNAFNQELTEKSAKQLLDKNYFNQALWLLQTKRNTIDRMPSEKQIFYLYIEAEAYSGIGEFRLAEQRYLRMVDQARLTAGKDSMGYMVSLLSLGMFYHRLGDRPKVEQLAGQIIRFTQAHTDKISENLRTAALYLQKGSIPEPLLPPLNREETHQLTQATREDYGEAHPFYANALKKESFFAAADRDTVRLRELIGEQNRVIRAILNQNFLFMSTHQQTYLYQKYQEDLIQTYRLQHIAPDKDWASHCYDNALFIKGLLLRSGQRLRNTLDSQHDTTLLQAYDQWIARKQEIAYLATQEGLIAKLKRQQEEEKAEKQEKELAARTLGWQEAISLDPVNWMDIRKVLAPDEVCVEYITYPNKGGNHYAALLLRSDFERPLFIPLFEEKEISRLFPADTLPIQDQIHTLYNKEDLYQKIWQPISGYVHDSKRIYYSPSGILHKISFSATMAEHFPSQAPYELYRVSSTREILKFKEGNKYLPLNATLFGALRYDASESALQKAAQEAATREQLARHPWRPLRYSGSEIYQIKALLDSLHIQTNAYTGLSGNEEAFKSLDRSDTHILHISTHGYFLEDDSLRVNPMLRSGLILSGANRAWLQKEIIEDIEDGLLTADEISLLRLSHLRLAVLSACNTALGVINNSEGVFGLQRAFKLAGAQTLIISLWPVDDRATAEFMIAFYHAWLTGKEMRTAFTETQHAFSERYENPYYWAGFVMVD